MKKLHVIWDLDGTLVDSQEEVMEALKKSARQAGLLESDQRAPFRVGPTIDKILDEAFAPEVLSKEKKDNAIKLFRSNYDNCGFERTLPFDGIEAILQDPAFVHHIVTNKPDLATGRILEKLGWKENLVSVVTPYTFMEKSGGSKKAKSELFALVKASFPDASFVGIGDMATDAAAARQNNMPAIGVLWGTGTREELQAASCDFLCESADELAAALKSLEEGNGAVRS